MSLQDIIGQEEIIFVGPKELKDYFFECRKDDPFLNFKYFSLDELIRNVFGSYLNKEVIKLGLQTFENYTYSLVKEVSKFCFYCLDIEKSKNDKIINFCRLIEEKGYKKLNKDFLNLIKNRKIIFINLNASNYLKNLIRYFEIQNYEHREIEEFIEINENLKNHEFFNIGDELKYSLNKALSEIHNESDLSNTSFILDLNRYDYYLKLFLTNLDIPCNLRENKSYKDSSIFKDLYLKIEDDFDILKYLDEHKNEYDQEEFSQIYDLLSFYEIDNLKNKKINFKEILSSQTFASTYYENGIEFKKTLSFSKNKKIYLLGLDNTFLPKVIKDNRLFTYDYLYENGFDSLDETNLMKNKLEQAFIKQKNIVFTSFHFKDNNGKYSASYYLDAFKFKKESNEKLEEEFIKDVSKLYYRNAFDSFERSGILSRDLEEYKKAFDGKFLETFDSNFKRIKSYTVDENLKYSYSSLKTLYECPFAYFVDNVLHATIQDKNIYQKYGTIAHAILEDVYKADFDFDKSYRKALDRLAYFNVTIDVKEKKLFERFIFELKQAINTIILPHKGNMSFYRNYSEKNLEVNNEIVVYTFGEGDFPCINKNKVSATLKGKVDSILETNESHLYIIDYKTGNDTFSLNDVEKYQLGLQLPTYIYLLEQTNDKDLKGKTVDGVFLEKIVACSGRFYNYLEPEKEDLECLKYDGAFIDDYDDILKFDFTINEPGVKSPFVMGLALKKGKKIGLSKQGKGRTHAINREKFNILSQIVEKNFNESIQKIDFGSFHIAPFRKNNYPVGCTFCSHYDICFKKNTIAEEE